jgi:hypothetical protein
VKIAYDTKSYAQNALVPPPPGTAAAEPNIAALFDEPAAILELSNLKPEADNAGSSGIKDKSGALTRRLVAAGFQGEVRVIISEAYENLSEWIKAAMAGGKEAKNAFAAIRRLNRLIRRSQRKIGDLDKEDLLRQKQARAEKQQQEMRVKQLKVELYRRVEERKTREKRYLIDAAEPAGNRQKNTSPDLSPAALQAKINALAAAMAQLTAPPPATAGGETAAAGTGGEISVSEQGDGEA